MRKRLISLAGALLIGGASSVALAVPASAAPLTTVGTTALTSAMYVSPIARLSDTGTSTTTGTFLASFESVVLATVSY
jgi:hypothetical protein